MYVCALRPRGEPLTRVDVFGYIARLERESGVALHSIVEGPFAAFAVGRRGGTAQLGRHRALVGAGDVRLDNRDQVARLSGLDATAAETDLELVLAALHACGESCIPRLLGDFSLVVWDSRARKLLAVRDAFGVRPLYLRSTPDLLVYSSDAGTLQRDDAHDVDYIASWLAGRPDRDRTIWSGVEAVPAGTFVRQRGTVTTRDQYWSASSFSPADDGDDEANSHRFRELLERGIRARVEGAGEVWAQLSGGLDSSAIVALTGMVRGSHRIGGTITVVDSLGEGDERVHSDAVVERFGLRNEQVRDYWAWQDDGMPPPLTPHPTPMFPFYARDRRVHEIVQQAGARVLLSGMGADHYLSGSLDYITDLAGTWRIRAALREVTSWSIATRQSFWRIGSRYMIEPFLPALLRQRTPGHVPDWLRSGAAERLQGARHAHATTPAHASQAKAGHRFANRIAAHMDELPAWFEGWPFAGELEMRYPFLYRPLVEWSLRLPVRQRIRPAQRKWILREATRGVLPESVRTRSTKGGIDARILWSLHRERNRVDAMLKDPILAQLGCVDPFALRAAVAAARSGVPGHNVQLFSTLSLETWLRVRSGAWSVARDVAPSAA
jgi:asparagine synthase (glutamine-hydrolysing)